MINELLDLAKIEAGRMELSIGPMNMADTAEGLIHLIRPQAAKRKLDLNLKIEKNLPLIQTDPGKFQQIIFNFLSNALKFSPEGGRIELSAARHVPTPTLPDAGEQDNHEAPDEPPETTPGDGQLCVSVSDQGPGIPIDMHDRIFEKFTQLDQGVTREHLGTGLGLTISLELAKLLQGHLDLDSDTGRGATFSLIIPMVLEPQGAPLMPQDEEESVKGNGSRADSASGDDSTTVSSTAS